MQTKARKWDEAQHLFKQLDCQDDGSEVNKGGSSERY